LSSKEKTEQRALKLIIEAEEKGLLQSDLWKQLGITTREASRIAKKYEENGKIERERFLHNGRWTYKLYFTKQPVTLDSVQGCPCLICPEIDKCFRGGTHDPNVCLDLTAWIDPRIEQETRQHKEVDEKTLV
jgi:hypothetical protein